jgi:flavodoxin
MKNISKALIGLALAAGLLAGCGSSASGGGSSSTPSSSSAASGASSESTMAQASADSSAAGAESAAGTSASGTGSGKVLVVYYSATGNTAGVAEAIAEATGADLFEITPTEPYTDDDLDWTDSNSRVSREHDDPDLQNQVELTTTQVDNWDSYDTVFIGYPIWWGIAAWPVNQFVQNNDFSGKTVIPFCTSSSSGIGQSGENLADMAGTGSWQDGQRFSSRSDSSEVTAWAKSQINA